MGSSGVSDVVVRCRGSDQLIMLVRGRQRQRRGGMQVGTGGAGATSGKAM
jgi:hypothetical protein